MKCKAERCGTGVAPKRPFCTRCMQLLPYRITKNLWLEGEARQRAIADAIEHLKENSGAERPGYNF